MLIQNYNYSSIFDTSLFLAASEQTGNNIKYFTFLDEISRVYEAVLNDYSLRHTRLCCETPCNICMQNRDVHVSLGCHESHTMCRECFTDWYIDGGRTDHPTCVYCRQDLHVTIIPMGGRNFILI